MSFISNFQPPTGTDNKPPTMPAFDFSKVIPFSPVPETKVEEKVEEKTETPEQAMERTNKEVSAFVANLKENATEAEAEDEAVESQSEAEEKVEEPAVDKDEPAVEPAEKEEEEAEAAESEDAPEPVVEEKPKKKRATKKTKKAEEKAAKETKESEEKTAKETKETTDTPTVYTVDVSKAPDYETADEWMKSYYLDEKFLDLVQYFSDKITDIRIEGDMNAGTLNAVIGQIDAVIDELSAPLARALMSERAFNNKENGLVAKIRLSAPGKNLNEKKLEAIKMMQNSVIDGVALDFDYMAISSQLRYQALDQLMKRVTTKKDLCITMSAGLKMQSRI